MATRMRIAAYDCAVIEGEEIVITAVGRNGSPAGGVLSYVDASGHIVRLTPATPGGAEWRIGVKAGPVVQLPTLQALQPAAATVGAEFQFVLVARAINPVTQEEEPVRVIVRRSGQAIVARELESDRTDNEVEIAGRALDLYLGS